MLNRQQSNLQRLNASFKLIDFFVLFCVVLRLLLRIAAFVRVLVWLASCVRRLVWSVGFFLRDNPPTKPTPSQTPKARTAAAKQHTRKQNKKPIKWRDVAAADYSAVG